MAKVDRVTGSQPLRTEPLFNSRGGRAKLTDATDGRSFTSEQLEARKQEAEARLNSPVFPEPDLTGGQPKRTELSFRR